ncbi:hypothetical protein HBI56_122950 [Parastagonospora nodorum]|nr:hypothetical protein HBH53_102100 [Parastagonospora nodorum]KAH3956450.1 hypothetical protein HBH51_241470 [Parastagonospora nodorum]KAH3997198.1 hypothetical protein HBI10_149490 [Parastagonospora nodorum]KAH4020134.1 hypothetical protein HBI13_122610 [Parastagonospora nodorum]KAH4076654.1 hypothetical protein HBH50_008620 [Parastagonospora nodorum]
MQLIYLFTLFTGLAVAVPNAAVAPNAALDKVYILALDIAATLTSSLASSK